jgi:hypothetical protein
MEVPMTTLEYIPGLPPKATCPVRHLPVRVNRWGGRYDLHQLILNGVWVYCTGSAKKLEWLLERDTVQKEKA